MVPFCELLLTNDDCGDGKLKDPAPSSLGINFVRKHQKAYCRREGKVEDWKYAEEQIEARIMFSLFMHSLNRVLPARNLDS
jgi:hypothetical protein